MRAVILDMDGTLSDPSGRLHHLDGEKNWPAFHDAMGDDEPIAAIATLARILYAAAERGDGIDAVIIVTARHDDPKYRQLTVDWLELHGIRYHALYMRRNDDYRRDHLVKADILQQIIDAGYEPVLAVDDRPEVVRMWRDHGITTLQCAPDQPSSPYAGSTLLHMMVGPCSAGKSTYVAANYKPEDVVSTDALRMQLYGDLGHAPEALARVWQYAHALISARLANGVFTVLDATNLDHEDRAKVLALLPRGVFARYIVIDRDLDREKIPQRGWRTEDMVIAQHRIFRREEKAILAGDDHPWVTVQDKRKR